MSEPVGQLQDHCHLRILRPVRTTRQVHLEGEREHTRRLVLGPGPPPRDTTTRGGQQDASGKQRDSQYNPAHAAAYEGLNGGWSEMLSISRRLPRPRRASIIGAVSTASAASGTSVSRAKVSDSAVNDGTARVSFSCQRKAQDPWSWVGQHTVARGSWMPLARVRDRSAPS